MKNNVFITDDFDVVSLLCLKQAKLGGLSMLCSTITVYNEFKKISYCLKYLFKTVSR